MALEFDDMIDDTSTIISDWEVEVVIKEKSVVYDNEGNPTVSWSVVETINVVWEDTTGRTGLEIAGEFHSYEAKMFCPVDTTISLGNKVTKGSQDYEVEFIKADKDKKTIYFKEING